MNVLGISGVETAMPFKRRHWPGLDERDYRISQGQRLRRRADLLR